MRGGGIKMMRFSLFFSFLSLLLPCSLLLGGMAYEVNPRPSPEVQEEAPLYHGEGSPESPSYWGEPPSHQEESSHEVPYGVEERSDPWMDEESEQEELWEGPLYLPPLKR